MEPATTFISLSLPNNEHLNFYYKQVRGCDPEIIHFLYVKQDGVNIRITPEQIFVNGTNLTQLSDFKWYQIEQGVDEVKLIGNAFVINAKNYNKTAANVIPQTMPIAIPKEVKVISNRDIFLESFNHVMQTVKNDSDPIVKEDCLSALEGLLYTKISSVGTDHISIGQLHFNMGSLYLSLGEVYHEFAIKSFEKSLNVLEKAFPKNHAFLMPVIFNMLHLSTLTGDKSKAEWYWEMIKSTGQDYFGKREKIAQEFGANSPFMMAAYCDVKYLYCMNPMVEDTKSLGQLRLILEEAKKYSYFDKLLTEVKGEFTIPPEVKKISVSSPHVQQGIQAPYNPPPYPNGNRTIPDFFTQSGYFSQPGPNYPMNSNPFVAAPISNPGYPANNPGYPYSNPSPFPLYMSQIPGYPQERNPPPVYAPPAYPNLPKPENMLISRLESLNDLVSQTESLSSSYNVNAPYVPAGYSTNMQRNPPIAGNSVLQAKPGDTNKVWLNNYISKAEDAWKRYDLAQALQFTSSAIELLPSMKDNLSLSELYFNKASLHFALQDYRAAEGCFLTVLQLQENRLGKNHVYLACTLHFLNMLSIQNGNENNAKGYSIRLEELNSFKDANGNFYPNKLVADRFDEALKNLRQDLSASELLRENCNLSALNEFKAICQELIRLHGKDTPYLIGIQLMMINLPLPPKEIGLGDKNEDHWFHGNVKFD